jgi:long-chain acyl-CoA synthetase
VWTLDEVAANVAAAAAGLRAPAAPRSPDLLMMRNRPDFHWFDMAAQFLRATPGEHLQLVAPDEIQYLAHHAEAEIAIVEDAGLPRADPQGARRAAPARADLRDQPTGRRHARGRALGEELMSAEPLDLAELAADTSPDDIATLIYTSGTTGPPKGVMISQYNVVYTVEQLRRCIDFENFVGKRAVSYLPMAHIAERMMSHYQWMMLGTASSAAPTRASSRST